MASSPELELQILIYRGVSMRRTQLSKLDIKSICVVHDISVEKYAEINDDENGSSYGFEDACNSTE